MKTCNSQININKCNCTYPCSKKGICCDCILYHKKMGELPACYFSKEFEKTYDRSIENYIRSISKKN